MAGEHSREKYFAWAGVVLFALCGLVLAADWFSDRTERSINATDCKTRLSGAAALPEDNTGRLRIVGLLPSRVELGSTLCIAVAGVTSQTKLDALAATVSEMTTLVADRSRLLENARSAAAQKSADENAVAAAEQKYRQARVELQGARSAAETGQAPVRLSLFLGGKRVDHLSLSAEAGPAIQYLTVALGPAAEADARAGEFWRTLLAGPTRAAGARFWDARYKVLPVGLSRLEGDNPEPMVQPVIDVLVYRMSLVMLGGAGALCLIAALVLLARSTTLLRDHAERPDAPYSLARVQLAMWAVLVFFGFVFIWLVLGRMNGILNESVLVLLGISATTGLVATQMPTRSAAPAAAAGDPAPVAEPPKSQSFFRDILYDGAGPTLPRMQMLAWSVLLGVIFVWNVLTGFTFTEFDTNLLIMLGIAGSSYVAFKPVETAGPVAPPVTPPAPAPIVQDGEAAQNGAAG